MSELAEEKQSRREMCRSLVRYLVLGGMGLIWAGLYLRSSLNSTPYCIMQQFSCQDCAQQSECKLPQAIKTRETTKGNVHGQP